MKNLFLGLLLITCPVAFGEGSEEGTAEPKVEKKKSFQERYEEMLVEKQPKIPHRRAHKRTKSELIETNDATESDRAKEEALEARERAVAERERKVKQAEESNKSRDSIRQKVQNDVAAAKEAWRQAEEAGDRYRREHSKSSTANSDAGTTRVVVQPSIAPPQIKPPAIKIPEIKPPPIKIPQIKPIQVR